MAKKTLVIVESPAKSHTISKYLGDDFMHQFIDGACPRPAGRRPGDRREKQLQAFLRGPARQGPGDQGTAQAGAKSRAASCWLRTPTARAKPSPFTCRRSSRPKTRTSFACCSTRSPAPAILDGGGKAHGHRRPQGRFPADAPPAGPPGRLQDQPGAAAENRRPAFGRTRAVDRPETDRGTGEGDPGLCFRGVLDRCRRTAEGSRKPLFHRQAGKIQR